MFKKHKKALLKRAFFVGWGLWAYKDFFKFLMAS